MSQTVDFSVFHKEMKAKTELPLNFAGVNLDRATENAEIVTDNVLYYVSHIYADGNVYDGNYRLLIQVTEGDTVSNFFARQWHSIDDVVLSGACLDWDPGKEREGVMILDEQDSDSGISYFIIDDNSPLESPVGVKTVYLTVYPKYEAITGDPMTAMPSRFQLDLTGSDPGLAGSVAQNVVGRDGTWGTSGTRPIESLPLFMRCMYGMLGIYGGDRTKSMRWLFKKSGLRKTSNKAVLSQKRFNQWIDQLTAQCASHGIGVKADIFDTAYATEVNVEDATREDYKNNRRMARAKHRTYLAAVKASDITRTGMSSSTSFDKAYGEDGELYKFLAKFGNGSEGQADLVPLMSYADGMTQNAVIPSMRDVFKAWYYDADELESEFNDNFISAVEGLTSARLGWKCISSKYRTAMYEIAGKYKEFPTDGYTKVALDLSYILNEMKLGDYKPAIGNDYYLYPRIVQRGSYPGQGKVMEYTLSDFVLSSSGNAFDLTPRAVAVPVKAAKDSGWKTDSCTKYSADITFCYTIDDRRKGSSDYVNQGAPEDIYRRRSANEGVDGSTVMEQLVTYFNHLISKNDDFDDDVYVTSDDYELDETGLAIRTDDIFDSETGEFLPGNERASAVWYFRKFMFYNSCIINRISELGFLKDNIDTMISAMVSLGGAQNYIDHAIMYGTFMVEPTLGTMRDGTRRTYDIINWEEESVPGNLIWHPVPVYDESWSMTGDSVTSVGPLCDMVEVMHDAYKAMVHKLPAAIAKYGTSKVSSTLDILDGIADDIDALSDAVRRIRIYQMFAQESVFTNRSMVGGYGIKYRFGDVALLPTGDPFIDYSLYAPMWNMPGRLMIPVKVYKKVRKRYRKYGHVHHKTVNKSIGVRWAEIQFFDTSVYSEYPQVDVAPGIDVVMNATTSSSFDGTSYRLKFSDSLPDSVVDAGNCTVYIGDSNGNVTDIFDNFTVSDDITLVGEVGPDAGEYTVLKLRIPLPASMTDDTKYPVTIEYNMPHLPYDSEIREKAFVEYGPLSQDRMFDNDGGEERHDGWRVFHASSSSLRDLRSGTTSIDSVDKTSGRHTHTPMCTALDLSGKVATLVRILSEEFGASRVKVIETYRSLEDQKSMCTGSDESQFLSWHNYGLAAKIVVYGEDGSTPADLYGEEFKRMVPIARAFTDACLNGKLGAPCNVVWCRRLAVSPSLFDWEFLPIGVGHKDAPKFREDTVNQLDPVRERSFVDVDSAGYVKNWTKYSSTYMAPYVLSGSSVYTKSTLVNGRHYIAPWKIRNFVHSPSLVLYDVKEYIDLVKLKMDANGTKLPAGVDMPTWMSINRTSCEQLIQYFAMTDNVSGARALIGGMYHDAYNYINTMYYSSDPVRYVKEMLGDGYSDATIRVDSDGNGSYISLKDGRVRVISEDAYPETASSDMDIHGSSQVTPDRLKHGNWVDGKFYTLDERPVDVSISETPVIDGYSLVDGEYAAVSGDAVAVHAIVAAQIRKEYDAIGKAFSEYSGPVMFDRFEDGPNYELADMLENEFGLIAAQDLIDFDELEDDIIKSEIETTITGDGTYEYGEVYEKVVNNAEVAGMKIAELTSEHIHVNDRHAGVTVEDLYRSLTKKGFTANDLLAK